MPAGSQDDSTGDCSGGLDFLAPRVENNVNYSYFALVPSLYTANVGIEHLSFSFTGF